MDVFVAEVALGSMLIIETVSTTDGPASMAGPRRGARARKPSGRVTGPEWVQAFADASLASGV